MSRSEAEYFKGDRDFWLDADFVTAAEKSTYAMLWQSRPTDIAGIRKRNDQIDSMLAGLAIGEYRETLKILADREKIYLYPDLIWVPAAIWRNLGKGKCSPPQIKAVKSRLEEVVRHPVIQVVHTLYRDSNNCRYPIPTLSIPTPYPSDTSRARATVTGTVSVTGTVTSKESTAAPLPDFKVVNERWTKKVHKEPEEKQVYQFLEICRNGYKAGKTTPARPVDANPLDVLDLWNPQKTPSPFALLAAMAKKRDDWAAVGDWGSFVRGLDVSPKLPTKEINKSRAPELLGDVLNRVQRGER